ncbi:MAG: hypothetical protein KDJ26_01615 [Alphaproteobacteria bacterium]|nr:hypothetical protein [Alphaproteobacteria bacterium]MCB9985342.1 hypothetical protein [Micavibrio sp.]
MSEQVRFYSFADFLFYLWETRIFLLIGGVLGGVLALVLVVTLKPQYDISMIVAPPRQGAENLNFLVEDLPPVLAPVASQTTSRDGEYTRFQQSLRGPAVATVLIKMDGILESLNHKTVFRGQSDQLLTAAEVSSQLMHDVRFEPLGATESLRLRYRHPDSEFGTKMLRSLVKISDQLIRLDVRRDVDARIEWLKRELKSTLNPEHRQSLTRLLMAEERRQMLLSIETPYALSVIEDAMASPRPVVPRFVLLFPLLVLSGMVVGGVVFSLRADWKKTDQSKI